MLKKKLTELLGDFDESKKERFKEIFDTAVDEKAAGMVKKYVDEAMDEKLDVFLRERIEQAVKKKLKDELQKRARKLVFRTVAVSALCVCGCMAVTHMAVKSRLKVKENQ